MKETTPNEEKGVKHTVVAYTERSQEKQESRHTQLIREYGFHPRSKVQVEDGSLLPRKFEPFPENMYGRPLEEIDSFIYEETFCVVSKRFRKNYIHRFTGTKALFWFAPWNPARRACVFLATNVYFDYCVMATILFNCVFLAMSETVEEAEYLFLGIYTCEMVIKIIAKGFALNKYTYLRNPWNWLDFVVITSGYATIAMDVGNLAGLRTFRVLRALKTVSIMPGLKTIINALLHSFKQLAEVMTLTIFCLMVFALFALQVYMGELRNKCVKNLPDDWNNNSTEYEWQTWVNNSENWIFNEEELPMICGNLTGARHCPTGYFCLCVGENPNHGYTNFDNFMWSMLTTFQLITLDYWENVYNMVLAACGPMSVSFFTIVVFFGSFYLINLMLAVVALSYEEESQITNEEKKKDLIDHRDDSTFSFDPAHLNLKQLSKTQHKGADSRKNLLLASYSRKKKRRRTKAKDTSSVNGNNNGGSVAGNDQSKSRSVTPSPSPSPRHSCTIRPQALAVQRTKGIIAQQGGPNQTPNTLHPLGINYRGQLLPSSRQASSNASEGGVNRESSLDDSGVVDDHEDQETGTEHTVHRTSTQSPVELQNDMTPVTLALSPHEVRIIKCNGNIAKIKNQNVYDLHPEYLSQIVVLDDVPDRNCDKCVQCCVDYEGWLQFQNCLYKIVKDPLFELAITLCIVLNTIFLALEHHGMSESVREALDIGNKVFTSVFTFECIMKVIALSKDFFLCGWNIFDLIIVSASLLDLIFELVDGLSVLRGLRLLRVLKLAQSWTTMKVLLSIIISTIGALGNLTFVLVIVIYIFAVIGMQLFSKDYTPDKFYPDPVPRWNFNDFFHSFMMIFRILCGEWIEPLWDCMRAEEKQGSSSCFAIFLPALVMGNFMVLNLFLALLLNSFNSEELKSKKEEVGEDSKLARSFERIRSIVRRGRLRNKEKTENDANTKLEQLVNEIVIKRRNEKKKFATSITAGKQYLAADFQHIPIYSSSYHESLNRPISGSDFCYDIPLKPRDQKLKPISGSQETVREMDDRQLPEDAELADGSVQQTHQVPTLENMSERKKKYFKQMSSGFGTQHSKDEPNDEEPFDIQHMNYFSSIDGNEPISLTESSLQQQMEDGRLHHPSAHDDPDDPDQIQYDEQYVNYQKSLLNRSPSYRKSLDRISLNSEDISVKSNRNSIIVSPPSLHQINNIILDDSNKQTIKTLSPPSLLSPPSHFASSTQQGDTYSTSYDTTEIPVTVRKSSIEMRKHSPQLSGGGGMQRSPYKTSNSNNISNNRKSLKRLSSDQSINTNSLEQDDMMNQMNLKDELLNCDKKELFQFLNDDSNNYFSDTVGYSSALLDSDTDSLILNEHSYRRADDLMSPPLSTRDRKISNGSLKSNLSSISNTIFQVLEHRRGGSLSGSDKVFPQTSGVYVDTPPSKRHSMLSRQDSDEKEPLVKTSDFDDIINEFDTEMRSLKSQNQSLERRDTEDPDADQYPKYNSTDTVLRRPKPTSDGAVRSDVAKRRSLEKQKKVVDEEFNIGNEIRKLCEQLQNPFPESLPEGFTSSPGMRRKSDFQNSFERIKRISLIERVEEDVEDEKPRKIVSDKLPRRNISKEKLETFSLRSNLSLDKLNKSKDKNQGDFDHFSLAIGREHVKVKKSVTLRDPQVSEETSTPKKTPTKSPGKENIKNRPWHCLVTYVDELTVGGRRNSQGEYDDTTSFPYFGRNAIPKVPEDCFPIQCYENCACWNQIAESYLGQKWMGVRTNVLMVVDTPAFEWFVLVLIFASSITLCFEDIHLDENKSLKRILYWTNFAFCIIFVVEMIMKWIAFGFTRYFSSFWTILDFIIVFVSVFSLLIEENENLKVLRSLRTLRALRPLRAISRWQGMRIVVNALMYAIPSIFNVLLVCLVFWLIFSIMGVQFFGGKFFKCLDDDGELLDSSVVNDMWECINSNYSWVNSKITFDHVGMGYLALFQVATFEGWMEVMADAVDARGVDLQPQREANLYAYIYFVIFIVCGSFFTLNLFIGVIIDNFNMLKKKYEGGVLEMFLTESQKHYYTAMKKLGRKKPQKVIKRPINQFMAMFYDLSNSRRFEIAIFVLIFLNMLTMGIEHYDQPHAIFFVLEVSNAFFTTVFSLECIVKIVGLRYHYFTVPWNVFDFLLVLASIFGILMEDIMIDLPVSPTLLRVVRVFRIGRILRLIKAAKGIRKLLFALVVSLPALFNIGALLALITFIYAIIGMSLFGHVKQVGALDDMVNFTTFGRSMQLLFRLMTAAGWNDVLEALMIQPPHCNLNMSTGANGDCGHPLLAITYFTSFIIISYMIVINMYIAIILENFNQAHQEEEIGIVEDDLEMFYIRWSKYDPHAGQFIHFNQLSDFIASLDPPLGIPKPNTVALVSFNLPISKGDKIHCLDILHALVKHVLGHVDETDNFKQLREQMDIKFKKQFPTRKELEIVSSTRIWKRQDKAAKLIQTTWREYLRLKKERERSPLSQEDENTQTSSPGGWQSKLQALNFLHLSVHRRGTTCSSRASSRKSSRCSDASDLSELAGPWLNLPLLLVGGAGGAEVKGLEGFDENKRETNMGVERKVSARRKSFINFPFFLRHQDALDDAHTSPSFHKKIKPSETVLSLSQAADKGVTTTTSAATSTPVTKSKRATSFVRKKPPLERGLSAQSALRFNRNILIPDGLSTSTTDVSILVTQPSPDVPTGPSLLHSESTLVHVLVHRESEEYTTDVDEEKDNKTEHRDSNRSADFKPLLEPHPLVTICVESPRDSPEEASKSLPCEPEPPLDITTDPNVPIDVNQPIDTSNIFYDYDETQVTIQSVPPPVPPRQRIDTQPLQNYDLIEYETHNIRITETEDNINNTNNDNNSQHNQLPPQTESEQNTQQQTQQQVGSNDDQMTRNS